MCFHQDLKEQNGIMSQRSDGVANEGRRTRLLHFTDDVYNDRLRVTSRVYILNFDLGESRVTLNRLI